MKRLATRCGWRELALVQVCYLVQSLPNTISFARSLSHGQYNRIPHTKKDLLSMLLSQK